MPKIKTEFDGPRKVACFSIPNLPEDEYKRFRKAMDNSIIQYFENDKYSVIQNGITKPECNTELFDKLVLLMIKARIDSEDYGIDIVESEISESINRLKNRGEI